MLGLKIVDLLECLVEQAHHLSEVALRVRELRAQTLVHEPALGREALELVLERSVPLPELRALRLGFVGLETPPPGDFQVSLRERPPDLLPGACAAPGGQEPLLHQHGTHLSDPVLLHGESRLECCTGVRERRCCPRVHVLLARPPLLLEELLKLANNSLVELDLLRVFLVFQSFIPLKSCDQVVQLLHLSVFGRYHPTELLGQLSDSQFEVFFVVLVVLQESAEMQAVRIDEFLDPLRELLEILSLELDLLL